MKAFYRILGLVVLSVVMLSGVTFAASTPFGKVVVFGDSLSDNGNMFALTGGAVPASKNSYQGRWSDGPVWIEYLTKYLSCGLVDLAEGGAKTGDETTLPVGVQTQVSDFISLASHYPTMFSEDTLFVLWAGANNFLGGGTDYVSAANDLGTALDLLAAAGARKILVANLPNFGAAPLINRYPEQSQAASLLAQAFNATLKGIVDSFKQTNTSIAVYYFDAYSLLMAVIADPGAYGFTDVTNAYVNADDTVNDNGEIYLFWDSVHPSTLAHKLIAKEVGNLLDGVRPAWYDSGLLYIPQLFLNGFDINYNVEMELVTIPSDPANIYFRVKDLKLN